MEGRRDLKLVSVRLATVRAAEVVRVALHPVVRDEVYGAVHVLARVELLLDVVDNRVPDRRVQLAQELLKFLVRLNVWRSKRDGLVHAVTRHDLHVSVEAASQEGYARVLRDQATVKDRAKGKVGVRRPADDLRVGEDDGLAARLPRLGEATHV